LRPAGGFDCGPHSIPWDLLVSLHALLRHSLNVIVGFDRSNTPFCYSGRGLSLLVLSVATEAVKLYCGIDNASAPFFGLACKMDQRMLDRQGDLLSRHSRGYEGMCDVLNDTVAWSREVLGSRAAMN
jgi:hypothetical protein